MKTSAVLGLLTLLIPASTIAQTLALYVDTGGTLTREYDVLPATPLDVVTVLDAAGHDVSALEWVQGDLAVDYPGVFRLNVVTLGCPLDLDMDPPGEFVFGVCGGCAPASDQLEVARLSYLDPSGALGSDAVMTVRGFEPGDNFPSSFDGSPGFIDCSDNMVTLVMQGGDPWLTGAGVEVPSGALVLNPTPPLVIEAVVESVSRVKKRFSTDR